MKNYFPILFYSFLVLVSYDANGNNTFEGTRTRVAYNAINLPQQVQLLGGRGIKNMYAADGRKLKSEAKQGSEYIKEGTKTYCGNLVFDINDELDYIIFPEGRILYNIDDSTFKYEYHLKDHLGSTRVAFVPTTSGTEVVQENSYYPFGAPIADLSWSPKSTNRYKREGKEYISDFDWNKYDFTGRTFDSWTLRALQVDPMATQYYNTSPYALWVNNPLRVIDPTGMWTEDGNGFMDVLKQIASFFGIGKKPEDDEQAREYAERREALQNYNKDMKARVDKGQEVADYIPFVGAAFDMSDGMVNHDDATFAAGLGVFVLDIAGGELLKEAGEAAVKSVVKAGSRAFFSGAGTEAKAIEAGFQTLGQTRAGKNLQKLTKGMEYYGPMNGQPASQAWQWWSRLSATYAKGVQEGSTVNVFLNNPSPSSIWLNVEKPILQQRGVNIIIH